MRKLILLLILIIIAIFLIKRKDMTWRQSMLRLIYPVIMVKDKWLGKERKVLLNKSSVQPPVSFYSLQAIANNGQPVDFSQFKGKKVLLVNTASDCGYTGQYDELEKLSQQYKDKLVVIGFPANDFKDQEQKNDKEIAEFCKINFGVTFPLMQKSHVIKNAEQNAVFNWLSDASKNGWCDQQPVWNFSKYLVDEKGVLVGFFANNVSPLGKEVKELLAH